jgi:hypothetical protein
MTGEKLDRLEDMGFQWSVKKEREDAMWNQRYGELKKFKEEHGHCRVPRRSGIGEWVNHQKRKKNRDARSEERTGKLEAVGFFDA